VSRSRQREAAGRANALHSIRRSWVGADMAFGRRAPRFVMSKKNENEREV
jgi:hypothetical protein